MSWAALITWIVTAGGGFALFGIWLKHGGMQQRERGRIRPALILTHFLLAATGLVLWIIYVVNDSSALPSGPNWTGKLRGSYSHAMR